MCRLLGYCSRGEVPVAHLMGDEGFHDFTALSALHGDGWGMAWYEAGQPQIRKSPLCAEGAPEFDKLAQQPLGDLGLLHLRWATPGLGISDSNCHPFRYGPYVLAHNGAIHPQHRLPELLPPEWERQLAGSTDSERYFLGIMSRLAAHDGDMAAAIASTAAGIERMFSPNSLNAILLSPEKLYAISWHDPAKVPEAQLRLRGYGDRPDEIAAYFDLAYRVTDDAIVVASSGWPQPGWTPLPNRHLLVADRSTLRTSVLPLSPDGPPAAGQGYGPAFLSAGLSWATAAGLSWDTAVSPPPADLSLPYCSQSLRRERRARHAGSRRGAPASPACWSVAPDVSRVAGVSRAGCGLAGSRRGGAAAELAARLQWRRMGGPSDGRPNHDGLPGQFRHAGRAGRRHLRPHRRLLAARRTCRDGPAAPAAPAALPASRDRPAPRPGEPGISS